MLDLLVGLQKTHMNNFASWSGRSFPRSSQCPEVISVEYDQDHLCQYFLPSNVSSWSASFQWNVCFIRTYDFVSVLIFMTYSPQMRRRFCLAKRAGDFAGRYGRYPKRKNFHSTSFLRSFGFDTLSLFRQRIFLSNSANFPQSPFFQPVFCCHSP